MFSIARARQFVGFVLPAILRPLRVLWNQIIGFFFICMAIIALWRTIPLARSFAGDVSELFRLLVSGVFIVITTGFGIYSFWRAHKVPK